ncbi:MAG TPA: hypothetical protein VM888_02135, partial [Chitinophagaceae bacterium]|nr:hypothetical protein [Chitinophagaceae bacterium]
LYHAYDTAGGVYTGRQGLLREFHYTNDGWVEFVKESPTDFNTSQMESDAFIKNNATSPWQWSVFQNVERKIKKDKIELAALPSPSGAFIGQKTYSLNYDATTKIDRKKSSAVAGIALIGDESNTISAFINEASVSVVRVKNGKDSMLYTQTIPKGKTLYLRMQVRNGKDITFLYSNNGRNFSVLNKQNANGAYLPPWDRALRAGVIAKGTETQRGIFKNFEISNVKIYK